MNLQKWGWVLFCLIMAGNTARGQYTEILQKLLREPKLQGASWGLSVLRCSDGQVLLAHNEHLRLVPASVQKLLITFAALEMLGPDFRFRSQLFLQEVFRSASRLEADWVVDAAGNPAFGSVRLSATADVTGVDSLLRWLNHRGVSSASFRVVTLPSSAALLRLPPDWYVEDLAYAYGAWPSPFVFRENLAEIKLNYQNDEPILFCNGSASWPSYLRLEVISDPKARRGGRLSSQLLSFDGAWQWHHSLSVKPGDSAFFRIPDPQPEISYFETFRKRLAAHFPEGQVHLEHGWEAEPTPQQRPFFVVESLPLAALDSVVNHESNNFISELLLWKLFPDKRTYSEKVKALEDWWNQNTGLEARLEDASGLSRSNLISPLYLSACLQFISRSRLFDVFYASLPQWGVAGTLQKIARPGEASYACARAKSGSMTGIQCYAGFIPSASEGLLCFTFMFNNFTCSASDIQKICNQLLNEICKQAR